MAYCCGRTSLHCYYVKMCRTGEYACDTCSTHFYIIAGRDVPFVYLRKCIFYAHAAYTSTVLDLGKSRLTHSRSPTETMWRMRSALKWRHTLQSKLLDVQILKSLLTTKQLPLVGRSFSVSGLEHSSCFFSSWFYICLCYLSYQDNYPPGQLPHGKLHPKDS